MIEMAIDSIRASLVNHQRVVILKENVNQRCLPIWVGPVEADAIAVKLHQVSVPRPLTHDLLSSVVTALGADLHFIVINDLREDTFYAKLALGQDGKEIEVDARPSDAMALAVRAHVPIYVEESVLNKAGFTVDKESGKPLPSDSYTGKGEPPSDEELKRLEAFTDFIDSLDLKDFGPEQK
ncbi:MAG: bifunctional nuclease family protein [Chloroflexota bacterium]|nr:bifunctional nuclease family protein [Chloroflexota bacterium]